MSPVSVHGKKKHTFTAYELGRIVFPESILENDRKSRPRILPDTMPVPEVHDLYHRNPDLDFLPVEDQSGRVTGYLTRRNLQAALGETSYSMNLLLRSDVPVSSIMDKRVVCLDAYTRLPDASRILMEREEAVRFDPFVVLLEEQYFGFSTVRRVLDGLNLYVQIDMQACSDAQQALILTTGSNTRNIENTLSIDMRVSQLKEPGGDYVAAFEIGESLSVVALFDVCGKGLKASNMVMAIGSIFKSWADLTLDRSRKLEDLDPAGEMAKLNHLVYSVTPYDMYATGVVLFIDKINRRLQLFDYGHGFLWIKEKGRVRRPVPEDCSPEERSLLPFFGVNENYRIEPFSLNLKEGDMIFSCSDGIVEGFNSDHEEFTEEGVVRALEDFPGEQADELSQFVLQLWEKFCGGYRRNDDVSLFSLRF